jgi:hypothetical protein
LKKALIIITVLLLVFTGCSKGNITIKNAEDFNIKLMDLKFEPGNTETKFLYTLKNEGNKITSISFTFVFLDKNKNEIGQVYMSQVVNQDSNTSQNLTVSLPYKSSEATKFYEITINEVYR